MSKDMPCEKSFLTVLQRFRAIADRFVKEGASEAVRQEGIQQCSLVDLEMLKMRFPPAIVDADGKPTTLDVFGGTVYCEMDRLHCSAFMLPRPGDKLALHDHPDILGFIRPIAGRIKVESYTWLNEHERKQEEAGTSDETRLFRFPARYEGATILDAQKPTVITTAPCKGNLHSLEALEPVSAFFDLLLPGYESLTQPKNCLYFANDDGAPVPGRTYWLREIPCPNRFGNLIFPPLIPSSDHVLQ